MPSWIDHWRHVARGVPLVADALGLEDFVQRHRFAALGHLALPPAGTLDRVGDEEELAGGVGEGHGALVAALADDVAAGGDGALALDEEAADQPVGGRAPGGGGHFGRADSGRDVLAVQPNAARFDFQAKSGQQPRHGRFIVEVGLCA